ncbi:unnamed protein product [Didymodactylos carnosus]|uniref:Uncharacterized protein n=1 Tax=Didymodactylos carnosus TaxID=1234261 RepID=A0A814SQD0_9BILA|nr:unnamed protein product [Didymodactylos carnosus]CAF3914702.1 unnamed protein product [Didymodactylos carnosus]
MSIIKQLREIIQHNQNRIDGLRRQVTEMRSFMRAGSSAAAVERPVDLSSPPLISSDLSITTITSPLIEVGSTIAIHLKPADFPKFTGKESEDIDEWIAQVTYSPLTRKLKYLMKIGLYQIHPQ